LDVQLGNFVPQEAGYSLRLLRIQLGIGRDDQQDVHRVVRPPVRWPAILRSIVLHASAPVAFVSI
jgi:hypothetical protein